MLYADWGEEMVHVITLSSSGRGYRTWWGGEKYGSRVRIVNDAHRVHV